MECPFRQISSEGTICTLAKKILKSENNLLYIINEQTCEQCFATKEIPNTKKINTVVAEILKNAANKVIELNGTQDCSVERAGKLLEHISNPKKVAIVQSIPDKTEITKKDCGCKNAK